MNILMCDTQYTFYLYYLLTPFNKFRDTFFVFDACFSPSIVEALEGAGMACHQRSYYHLPLEQRPAAREENREYLVQLIKEFSDYFKGDICIYGQDHIDISQILWNDKIRDIPFILLEDGVGNYRKKTTLDSPPFLQPGETTLGHNDRVLEIYLTGIWRIPNDLKRKVRIMDLRDLWGKKSHEEKQFFLGLYSLSQDVVDTISKKSVCFLGGAFSNFGLLSLEQELRAYQKILSQFDASDIYIKAHPTGGNIDYEKIFPKVPVIMNPVPFEALYFLTGRRLQVVASIASTASMIVDEEVDQQFYDYEGTRIHLKSPCEDLV